jgi:hypothetical protein
LDGNTCTPTSSDHHEKLTTINEMFPSIDTEKISEALSSNNGDVEKVVNNFLSEKGYSTAF